jgi:fatty acid desaturase
MIMEPPPPPPPPPSASDVSPREARFLDRLSDKYRTSETTGRIRSYLIAAAVIAALFALARWIPWWWLAALAVEVIGLALFRQYKRFAGFKSMLLRKLWRLVQSR